MRTTRLVMALVAALLLVGGARPADAFKQSLHRSMTKDSCLAAGLPRDFCSRVAVAAYNTDAYEWDDLLAHAQMSSGESLCFAANRVQGRMRDLGRQLEIELDALAAGTRDAAARVGTVGELVGRALHTLQDSYAHHGMSNPQHAWFSLQDLCTGTKSSPDLRPGAADQARAATEAFLAGLAPALRQAGVEQQLAAYSCPEPDTSNDPNARGVCDSMSAPAPWDVCSFLGEAGTWDGVDREWDNGVVGPSLIAAFVDQSPYDLCQEATLAAPPVPPVDVASGPHSCPGVHLVCLGKADETVPAAAAETGPAGGCSAAPAPDGTPAGLALLSLGLGLALVRRAARRAR